VVNIKKILIIRLRFIGDIVLTTPLIESIKKAYPTARLYYLAEAPYIEILKENPYLDKLLICKKGNIFNSLSTILNVRKEKFDIVIDLFGNPRSALITYLSGAKIRLGWNLRGRRYAYNTIIKSHILKKNALDVYQNVLDTIGIKGATQKTKVYLSKEEKKYAFNFLKTKGINFNKKIIGIHPGASWPAKMWQKEKFVSLGEKILKLKGQVIVFGGPKDKEVIEYVYNSMKIKPILVSDFSLREFSSILSMCDLFITNDNGPMHIAIALNVPTIAIFGPSEPDIWFPYRSKKFKFIKKDVICWPCKRDFCDDLKCMEKIKVSEVFNLVKKLWI